jgi:glutamyl-tRNA reductase
MAAASVRLAGQLFESLHNTQVLLIGAGEMIELCATHFNAKQPKRMVIANRTAARGEALAQRLGVATLPLAEVPLRLSEFDIVISCTASTLPIIGLGAIESALKQRKNKPMFMVDLAVPRDIEAEAAQLESVYLYTVDDLAKVVRSGQEARQSAVKEAELIIDYGVNKFNQWLQQRDHVPLIQQLNTRVEGWRSAELEKAKKMIEKGEDIHHVLDLLSQRLTKKMMHGHVSELASHNPSQRASAKAAIEQLFLKRD